MKIRPDVLMAILTYISGGKNVYMTHSILHPNTVCFSENPPETKWDGNLMTYNLVNHDIIGGSVGWTTTLFDFSNQRGTLYAAFMTECQEMTARIPEHEWFVK